MRDIPKLRNNNENFHVQRPQNTWKEGGQIIRGNIIKKCNAFPRQYCLGSWGFAAAHEYIMNYFDSESKVGQFLRSKKLF